MVGMKLLITGSGGLLGSAIRTQSDTQYEVLAPTRGELDLEDPVRVQEYINLHKPDLCIHSAAQVYGLGGHKLHPNKALLVNSRIDLNLITSFNEIGLEHFVYIGTVASYGYPYKSLPLLESDFFQGVPHAGEYGYAMAKRFGYDLSNSLKLNGTTVSYAVMTNLYGPNDNFNEKTGHVIPSLISRGLKAKKESKKLEVWGSEGDSRDFLYSEIAATRILQILNSRYEGLINIGSGVERKVFEVAEFIANYLSFPGISIKTGAVNAIHNRTLSIETLENLYGKIHPNFEKTLSTTIDWLAKNLNSSRH
jgi:GDP-L-fucose synthase